MDKHHDVLQGIRIHSSGYKLLGKFVCINNISGHNINPYKYETFNVIEPYASDSKVFILFSIDRLECIMTIKKEQLSTFFISREKYLRKIKINSLFKKDD